MCKRQDVGCLLACCHHGITDKGLQPDLTGGVVVEQVYDWQQCYLVAALCAVLVVEEGSCHACCEGIPAACRHLQAIINCLILILTSRFHEVAHFCKVLQLQVYTVLSSSLYAVCMRFVLIGYEVCTLYEVCMRL